MNIICLYWVGKFRNRDFTVKDVVRLRESVDKHIDTPYTFYCLTNAVNSEIPAEKIMLKHNWPGWWSKIELHRQDLPKGRTLYLDLDSHVIRPLAPLLEHKGDLVMFETKTPRFRRVQKPKIVQRYQAATMLFTPGKLAWIYDKFRKNPNIYMAKYRSDQDIMGEWIPNQPLFPGECMKKLSSCVNTNTPPEDVIIVTGQPKSESFRNPATIPWLEPMARG